MRRCPITYEQIGIPLSYSSKGLKALGRNLRELDVLEFTVEELLVEAARRAGRMSVGGVQPKLSAVLEQTRGRLRVVDTGGRYIVKPPHPLYREMPENEDLTMRLAATAGIEVPFHCLVYGKDGALSYLVRRYDRIPRAPGKVPVEDFAQLSGRSRDTKYDSSLERVIGIVDSHCTFSQLERSRLFRRVLFSFLVGNEDMHLKNYSLISRNGKVELSPAYDLINTTLVLGPESEESALPVDGRKRGFTRKLLVDYLGRERCQLPAGEIAAVLEELRAAQPLWHELVQISFLTESARERYLSILQERAHRLFG